MNQTTTKMNGKKNKPNLSKINSKLIETTMKITNDLIRLPHWMNAILFILFGSVADFIYIIVCSWTSHVKICIQVCYKILFSSGKKIIDMLHSLKLIFMHTMHMYRVSVEIKIDQCALEHTYKNSFTHVWHFEAAASKNKTACEKNNPCCI